MKKNVNIINMSIAIIPNSASPMVNTMYKSIAEMQRKNLKGHTSRFGYTADENELGVQIWYGSEEESFQNGGLPEKYDKLFPAEGVHTTAGGWQFDAYGNRLDILPGMLPAKMFEGKKEGDKVLIFQNENAKVYGVLNQKGNRYSWIGNFEDAFKRVYR